VSPTHWTLGDRQDFGEEENFASGLAGRRWTVFDDNLDFANDLVRRR
jgi:hypothetical protein